MSNLTDISDVIIIGSGSAGLSAAIYVVRAGLSVTVIEKEFMGTGQIADSSKVDNYLGIPAISGYDLGESFREHALSLGVTIEDNNVTRLTPVDDIWELELSDGSTKKARCVIYAAGCSHKKLQAENEEQYTGKGISYCAVCDGAFYKDKDVAVVGGGDTALSDALYLSDICANVYIIHRREEFRGAASLLAKLKERTNVHICTNRTVKKVEGSNNLERIILDNDTGIDVNGLFVAVGMSPQTELLKGIAELDNSGYVIAGEDCVTSARGLFVAGDVRTKILRQVITAAADGAMAATQAVQYLR
mgnify:FL=1